MFLAAERQKPFKRILASLLIIHLNNPLRGDSGNFKPKCPKKVASAWHGERNIWRQQEKVKYLYVLVKAAACGSNEKVQRFMCCDVFGA